MSHVQLAVPKELVMMSVTQSAAGPDQASVAIAGIFRKWFHRSSAEGGHASAPQVCSCHPAQLLILNAREGPAISRPLNSIQLH